MYLVILTRGKKVDSIQCDSVQLLGILQAFKGIGRIKLQYASK